MGHIDRVGEISTTIKCDLTYGLLLLFYLSVNKLNLDEVIYLIKMLMEEKCVQVGETVLVQWQGC